MADFGGRLCSSIRTGESISTWLSPTTQWIVRLSEASIYFQPTYSSIQRDRCMPRLGKEIETRLLAVARLLIDQQNARVILPPQQSSDGFWFGGGNLTIDKDGHLALVGRYRNVGDSRTGLGAGERGLELAIFRSTDRGESFQKTLSLSKVDLNVGSREVLSIEGSAIHWTDVGVELFVSTEKTNIGYPDDLSAHLKPGTGVWTIDRLQAESIEGLRDAAPVTVLESSHPGFLHVKDPVVYDSPNGDLVLMYCTHPFSWASSNTAYTVRKAGSATFETPCLDFFARGPAWDVAITRGTALLDLPSVGCLAGIRVRLLFYDGGESLRDLDQHASAAKRPRGYSCEELGGVAYVVGDELNDIHRLSADFPLFVSPYGTGCSRYVDVLQTGTGYFATWQQSQDDQSQPLVMNVVDRQKVESVLQG